METSHAHGLRTALLDSSGKKEVKNLPPNLFFQSMQSAMVMFGRQFQKSSTKLIDLPDHEDLVIENSDVLLRMGRTKATKFFAHRACCHPIDLREGGVAVVMPRTLYRWVPNSDDHVGGGHYEQLPSNLMSITSQEATATARMSVELNGENLLVMWRAHGIVAGARQHTYKFDFKIWQKLRYHRVAVLTGKVVERFWQTLPKNKPLCPCLPFGLGAHCEHVRFAKSFLVPEDLSLNTFAATRQRGRPAKVVFMPRGASSAQVMKTAMAKEEADEQRKLARHVVAVPQPRAGVSFLEPPDTAHRSDQAVSSFQSHATSTRANNHDSTSASSSGQSRGPTTFRTNFDLVQDVLGRRRLPPNAKIYFNSQNQACSQM